MNPAIDLVATQEALLAAAGRMQALFRSVDEPDRAVPKLRWTVAETAAHVVGDVQHYTGFVTGQRDPTEYLVAASSATSTVERNAQGNARLLAEFQERDLTRLADRLGSAVESFVEASTGTTFSVCSRSARSRRWTTRFGSTSTAKTVPCGPTARASRRLK